MYLSDFCCPLPVLPPSPTVDAWGLCTCMRRRSWE